MYIFVGYSDNQSQFANMSFNLTIPFYAVKLSFLEENSLELIVPLMDMDAVRIGQPLHLIAGQYAEELQRKALNKGDFLRIMEEYHQNAFEKGEISIHLDAASDEMSYPAMDLSFIYWVQPKDHGLWGVIPSLGVEVFVKDKADIEVQLIHSLQLYFTRKGILKTVQNIVRVCQLQNQELVQQELLLRFPSLAEMENEENSPQEKILPRFAQKLHLTHRITYGRHQELDQLERALKGEFTRNVLLVGASGVGKTALIWELVKQRNKRRIKGEFWESTASVLIKELTDDLGWKDNVSKLALEMSKSEDWLFIRNLMELFEVGQYAGSNISVAAYMRTFISRGEITMISECTPEELAQIEVRNPAFLTLFQIIRLEEPKKEQLVDIIVQKVSAIAQVRRVQLEQETINEVIRLNRRFTPYSGFPGKPIRFLESILMSKKQEQSKSRKTTVKVRQISRSEVIRYFCEDTGLPTFMVDPAIPMDTEAIKQNFNQQVFGQQVAVNSVVDLLASVKTSLTRIEKPIASLLFVGPTGVGKTELAKVLAHFMFGSRDRMIRFDMSEYAHPYAVQRLTGLSYHQDGVLTSAVRRTPFSVLLFDEIEKADNSFYDLLLQMLSEGRLSDSRGKLVNFCSTIIIMTSNIGASNLLTNRISWSSEVNDTEVQTHFTSAVEKEFRPELVNRIDQIISFAPLSRQIMRHVVEREMQLFRQREGVRFSRLTLKVADLALDYLAEKGYDPRYGARHLQRSIQHELIIPLARALNITDIDAYIEAEITVKDNQLLIHTTEDEMEFDLLLEELEKETSADICATLRRAIYRLKEGHFYIQLQNQLNQLENTKNRLGDKFWHDVNRSKKYTYNLHTKTKVEQLTEQIQAYENELSLAVMNLAPYKPEINDQVKQWKTDFLHLKLEIYTSINPKSDMVQLGLYGGNILPLFAFYQEILKEKEFLYTAKSVWFRKSYYEEIIEVSNIGQDENGNLQETIQRAARQDYLKKDLDLQNLSKIKPLAKNDKLMGIELSISGSAAFLFFNEESGYQNWKTTEKENELYFVKVENSVFPTPRKIHRKEFYKRQTYRRIISSSSIKDSILNLQEKCTPKKYVAIVFKALQERFKIKLEKEVM